ncbi:MAG: 4-alpha-glucanotransferase [Candidatus Binatota bacterium]|nr:4-alpha-glucanotransferase [Candidatus Binatota bacterium]
MTDRWGIDDAYEDVTRTRHETSAPTREALRAAMDEEDDDAPSRARAAVRVVRQGSRAALGPAELRLEDGRTIAFDRQLPRDVPDGYHELAPRVGAPFRLIIAPRSCRLPAPAWGWAVQLYACRSKESWGIGDLGDLARLAEWSAGDLGAGCLLVNPLHAAAPVVPQQPSPYYPTSRRFLNPLYLRIEDVPGAREAAVDIDPLAAAGRALLGNQTIDRDRVFMLKSQALELLWSRSGPQEELDGFAAEGGQPLQRFATYCALAERHGADWRAWPADYRRPESPAVDRFAAAAAWRVRFHQWLQWLLDRQLASVSRRLTVMQDLPIGVDPGGADAWAWQDVLARGVSVGAPPDEYNTLGQNWGLPPFVPHRLQAAGYQPFVETIRATLRNAGALRIDHAMGLFRLFWIPEGRGAAEGAYVRYPANDLLAIVALESRRAGAYVVGEDLGTVEDDARQKLATNGILSYRLLWFESDPPESWPERALAAVTTHDLPTIAGLWTGSDLESQRALDLRPNEASTRALRQRIARQIGLAEDAPIDRVIEETHRLLARAPSRLLIATLEDAVGAERRPNMPGTVDQWPNWSIPLPTMLDELERSPLARAVASALSERRRSQLAERRSAPRTRPPVGQPATGS